MLALSAPTCSCTCRDTEDDVWDSRLSFIIGGLTPLHPVQRSTMAYIISCWRRKIQMLRDWKLIFQHDNALKVRFSAETSQFAETAPDIYFWSVISKSVFTLPSSQSLCFDPNTSQTTVKSWVWCGAAGVLSLQCKTWQHRSWVHSSSSNGRNIIRL